MRGARPCTGQSGVGKQHAVPAGSLGRACAPARATALAVKPGGGGSTECAGRGAEAAGCYNRWVCRNASTSQAGAQAHPGTGVAGWGPLPPSRHTWVQGRGAGRMGGGAHAAAKAARGQRVVATGLLIAREAFATLMHGRGDTSKAHVHHHTICRCVCVCTSGSHRSPPRQDCPLSLGSCDPRS